MVALDGEARAPLRAGGLSRGEVLFEAHEIGGKLRRRELRAHPCAGGFTLFLERHFGHEAHCGRLVAHVHLHHLVEDGVGDGAQLHFELREAEEWVVGAEARFDHRFFGVARPAFDEAAGHVHGAEFGFLLPRVADLHVVARHRFVDRDVGDHARVVFAEE